MGGPNFRMLIRNLRLREEAKAKGVCCECGRKLPKPKPQTIDDHNKLAGTQEGDR